MEKNSKDEQQFKQLRELAEKLLSGQSDGKNETAGDQLQQLIHELEVHQVELRLQNEELRETQLDLQIARDKYREFYDFSPVGFATLDPDDRVLEANFATGRMLDAAIKDIVGQRFTFFISPESQDVYYLFWRGITFNNITSTCEIRLKVPGNSARWAHLTAIAVKDAAGLVIGLRISMIDISERKQTEQELAKYREHLEELVAERTTEFQQSEAKYRSIVETANEGIWVSSVEGKATFVNQKMAEMLGRTPQELLGHDVREFVAAGETEGVDGIREQLRQGIKTQVERKFRRKDGSIAVDLVNATPRFDEGGNYIGNFTMHTDITERKRAEEEHRMFPLKLIEAQEKERRAIGRELHDQTGQYLTALKLLLTKLSRDLPQAEDKLKDAANISGEVLQQVRELSHTLHPPMIDELGLIPALVWHFDQLKTRTEIKINLKTSGLAKKTFPADINLTAFRIIQEALTNVVRYAGVNEADVTVTATRDKMRLTITDVGCGFDQKAERLGGWGGIVGMRERAALVGGTLTVKSAPGKGTTVTAELPVPHHANGKRELKPDGKK